MTRQADCDLLVVGGGVAGTATALAVARGAKAVGRGKSRPSVCLVPSGRDGDADTVAASYGFLNPHVVGLLPALKPRLTRLTDGSFRGLVILSARDGRRAEFASRTACGYFVDGPRLLRELVSLCRSAGVRIVQPVGRPEFVADDQGVRAAWAGGGCHGRIALVTDRQAVLHGQVDRLGLRAASLENRAPSCHGISFAVPAARLDELFGRSRRLVTVWQLNSVAAAGGDPTSPNGQDAHAWLMPKRNSLAVGLMVPPPDETEAAPDPADLMDQVLGELRALNMLPRQLGKPISPVQSWHLPVAAALEIESHAAKRSLVVGLAGGFVSALSGQWLYPIIAAASAAATVVNKALTDPRPQDVLAQFGSRWRPRLADYLRSPNTRLAFLLPLVFGNQQIADRFARAYLFGENF